jgi:hypothetical protein
VRFLPPFRVVRDSLLLPAPNRQGRGAARFKYQLELEDGTSVGDSTAAVPNWKPGDTIPLGPGKSYRVIDVKPHARLSGVLIVRLT